MRNSAVGTACPLERQAWEVQSKGCGGSRESGKGQAVWTALLVHGVVSQTRQAVSGCCARRDAQGDCPVTVDETVRTADRAPQPRWLSWQTATFS